MAATRKTATQSNGGSDNGVNYTDGVDAEVGAIWQIIGEPLTTIGGTGDVITATADSARVSPVLTIGLGKKFHFTAGAANTGAVTIAIDGLAAKSIKDPDGAALQAGAIVSGRRHFIEFDGTNFRLLNPSAASVSSALEYGTQGGRLTLTTATPVLTTGVTAATVLYWTPDKHNRIGLYDGAAWSVLNQAEVSIKLTDAQSGTTHNGTKIIDGLTDTSQLIVGMKISGTNVGAAAAIQSIDSATQVTATVNSTGSATNTITFKLPLSTNYDVFGYLNSGALKLEFCKWTSDTVRATAIARQDGVPVKSGTTTRRLLGMVRTTATDGQTEFSFGGRAAGGTAANLLVGNVDNVAQESPRVSDSIANYNYNTGAVRNAGNSPGNRINFVVPLARNSIRADHAKPVYCSTSSGTGLPRAGIGLDSSTIESDDSPTFWDGSGVGGTFLKSIFVTKPSAGFHYVQALEKGGTNGTQWNTPDNVTNYDAVFSAEIWL